MFCSKCGRQLPDTAKFCNGCGSPTSAASVPERTAIPSVGMAVPANQRKGRVIAVSVIAAVLLLGGGAGFLFREQLFGGKNDSVRGDQGDTVRVPVMISNNPGFCGAIVDVQYDTSVLEIVGTYSGEAFEREMNAIY